MDLLMVFGIVSVASPLTSPKDLKRSTGRPLKDLEDCKRRSLRRLQSRGPLRNPLVDLLRFFGIVSVASPLTIPKALKKSTGGPLKSLWDCKRFFAAYNPKGP